MQYPAPHTHPHPLLIPRDSGVNCLPLYAKSHLPRVVVRVVPSRVGVVPRVVGVVPSRVGVVPRVVGVVPRVNGLHCGFLLSLELKRVLPIRLNAKQNQGKESSTLHTPTCFLTPEARG